MDDLIEDFALRPVIVPRTSTIGAAEVRSVLLDAGYAGLVDDHPDDAADDVLVLVLANEWGAPIRWREDVGPARFVGDSTWALRAVLEHRVAPGVVILDEDDDEDGGRFGARVGITSMAWYTIKNVDSFGGLVAAAAGSPVIVAPVGTSHVYVPVRGERLLDHPMPETNQSVLLFRTATRRGMFIRKRRVRALHWWDDAFVLADPSGGAALLGSGHRVRDIVATLRGEGDEVSADLTRAFGLDDERSERLRILCRRPGSDADTFAELVDVLGVPREVADVAEGAIDARSLPGSSIAEPQTLKENLAADWAEMRSVFREPVDPRASSPFDWWQRLTAKRPLWYTLLTIVLVGGSIAIAIGRLVAGHGIGSIWIQIGVIVVWTWSYVAPRRRFLEQERNEEGERKEEETRSSDTGDVGSPPLL